MSIESVARALQIQEVAGTTKLVLLGIANHDGDGGAWPTRATLARYAVCSERHVKRCIQELVDAGLVEVEVNAGGTLAWRDDRRPNRYILHLDGGTHTSPRESDGGTSETPRGDTQVRDGGTPMSPKPSSNHPQEPSTSFAPAPVVVTMGMAAMKGSPEAANRAVQLEQTFELFWATYGKVGPRKKARECWMKAVKNGADPAAIQRGLEAWCQYWRSPGAANVKWPQGWLNEERWKDDPPVLLATVQNRPVNKGLEAVARVAAQRGLR